MFKTLGALTDLEYVNVISLSDLTDIESQTPKQSTKHRGINDVGDYYTPEEMYNRYVRPLFRVVWPYNFEGQKERDIALVAAIYASGLRISELLNVKREQVSLGESSLIFRNVRIMKQKKGKVKIIDKALPINGPLAPFTMLVWEYIVTKKPQQLIFDLSRSRVFMIVKNLTGQWPHYFRHQYCSYLANQTDIPTTGIRGITGHTSSHSLDGYVHSGYKEFEGRY